MRSRAERTLAWPGDVIHTYSHFAATNGAKMVINLFLLSVVMCIVCTALEKEWVLGGGDAQKTFSPFVYSENPFLRYKDTVANPPPLPAQKKEKIARIYGSPLSSSLSYAAWLPSNKGIVRDGISISSTKKDVVGGQAGNGYMVAETPKKRFCVRERRELPSLLAISYSQHTHSKETKRWKKHAIISFKGKLTFLSSYHFMRKSILFESLNVRTPRTCTLPSLFQSFDSVHLTEFLATVP